MFKILKDTRRRAVESILETVGVAEVTNDAEFDVLATKFDVVIAEMNQVSGSISQMLGSQKAMFNDCKDLSQVIYRIYQSNTQDTSWPQSQNAYSLECVGAAEQYKQAWESIHDCVRSSVGTVCMTEAYDPLKDTSTQMSKAVDEEIKTRKACLTDFDSYRRRLKGLQQKRDKNEAQGKGNTPAHADTLAEIVRFEAKVQSAGENYHTENSKTKLDILNAKEKHDELLDVAFISLITAQAELFAKAHQQLEAILRTLPEDKVQEVRSRIQEHISAGGPSSEAQPKAKKFLGGFPSMAKSNESSPRAAVPVIAASPRAQPTPAPMVPPTAPVASYNVAPTPVAAPASKKVEYAIALYDNEVDDDEELAFTQGQRIEVIEKDDSGWYKGRLDGRVGLFPINYVKLE